MAGATDAAKAMQPAEDYEDVTILDDAKKPKMVRESSRCTMCQFWKGFGSTDRQLDSVDPQEPTKSPFVDPQTPTKSPKKFKAFSLGSFKESPKKTSAPKAKIGRRSVDVSASDGIDVAKVMESKPFKELIDSLAKEKKGFEALNIKILSVVEKPRIENCNYIVVRPDLPVCATEKRTSDKVATLDVDAVVKVLEIHEEDQDGRVRARIESPAGWISTSHHKGTIYAKIYEAVTDITSIECSVDAKIDGKLAPGTLFVRGDAAAVMVVLHVDGADKRSYTLLVQQEGVPDSLAAIGEMPAGIIDEDGNFKGALAKDILEKAGMEIKLSDLVDVTEAIYKDGTPNMFPSCGAKNFDKVFVLQERTTVEDLKKLETSLGEQSEGGLKLYLEPLENEETTPDNPAHPAVGLYEKLMTSGAISELKSKEWHFGKWLLNSFSP
jgi:hypothetical protein